MRLRPWHNTFLGHLIRPTCLELHEEVSHRGRLLRLTWALELLDGTKVGSIVGEVAFRECAAARHGRGWATLLVLAGCDVQRIKPDTTARAPQP